MSKDNDRFIPKSAYRDYYDMRRKNGRFSQKDACLDCLKRYNFLTHKDAESLFRCTRLAAVIWQLREEGWDIESIIPDVQPCYATYVLRGEKDG